MNQRASVTELFDDFELVVLAGGFAGYDRGRPEGDWTVGFDNAPTGKFAFHPLPPTHSKSPGMTFEKLKQMKKDLESGMLVFPYKKPWWSGPFFNHLGE